MPDNKPKLGEGIVDELTSVANEEISNLGKLAIRSVFKYLSDKGVRTFSWTAYEA